MTGVQTCALPIFDWRIALEFIAGGALGGFFGMKAAIELSSRKRTLTYIFSGVVFTVAAYMLYRTGMQLV